MYAFTNNKYINTKVPLVFGTGVERTEWVAEGAVHNPVPAQGELLVLGCSPHCPAKGCIKAAAPHP